MNFYEPEFIQCAVEAYESGMFIQDIEQECACQNVSAFNQP